MNALAQMVARLFIIVSLFGFVGVLYPTPLHKRLKLTKRWMSLVVWIGATLIAGLIVPQQPATTKASVQTAPVVKQVAPTPKTAAPKPNSAANKPATNDNSIQFHVGENCYTKSDTFMAFTIDDMTEVANYVVAHNMDAINQMVSDGRAIILPQDTKITVTDAGSIFPLLYKVHVMTSTYQGQTGFVDVNYLKKNK